MGNMQNVTPNQGIRVAMMGKLEGHGHYTRTQAAANLAKKMGACHLSTGELLQKEIKLGTPIGKNVRSLVARGNLVSDDIVWALVEKNLNSDECRNGFVLDGYPRNKEQAKKLDAVLEKRPLQAAIEFATDDPVFLKCDDKNVVARLCPFPALPSHNSFHTYVTVPFSALGDNEAAARKLVDSYVSANLPPLVNCYQKRGIYTKIDASQSIDKICSELDKRVNEKADVIRQYERGIAFRGFNLRLDMYDLVKPIAPANDEKAAAKE